MKRRYKKFCLGFSVASLALFVIGLAFYFFPVSGNFLDRRLSALLQNNWNRKVDVNDATLFFSKGLVTIRNLAVHPDHPSGQPLLIREINLEFSPASVLLFRPEKWRKIHLSFPEELPFVISDSKILPAERFLYLVPFLENLLQSSSGKKQNSMTKIHIDFNALSLSRFSSAKDKTDPIPLLKLEKLSLVFSFLDGALGVIASEGIIRSELQGDFRGLLTFHPDGAPDHLMLYFSHILLSDETLPLKGLRFDAVNLVIKEKIESGDAWMTLFHNISLDSFSMNVPGAESVFLDNKFQFSGATEFLKSKKSLNLLNAKLSIDDSDLILDGDLSLDGDYPFSLELEQTSVSPRVMNLIRRSLLSTQWDVSLPAHSVELSIEARGNLSRIRDSRILGSLKFDNLALRHKDSPLPLTGMRGLLTLDRSDIKLSGVTGRFGDGDFSLEARFHDAAKLAPPNKISLSWSSTLPCQDILMTIHKLLPSPEFTMRGELLSTGTLELERIPSDEASSFFLKSLGGAAELRKGILHLDDLPFEISDIHGRLDFKRDSIDFSRFSGRARDAIVGLSGKIKGAPLFWNAPHVSATIDYAGDVETLILSAPNDLNHAFRKIQPRGYLEITINLSIPDLDPARAEFSGDVRLENGAFVPDQPFINGYFQNLYAEARFVNDAVFMDRIDGEFSGNHFNLQGALDQNLLQFDLRSLLDLAAFRQAIPALADQFRSSGTLELNCNAAIPVSLLKSLLNGSDLPAKPDFNVSGTLRALDASFAYKDMPADLSRIDGLIEFSQKGFLFNHVKCWCGETPDCLIDGEVTLDPPPLRLRFKVHAPELFFAEWTDSWKSDDDSVSPHTTIRDMTSLSPTLEVNGFILADKIHFNLLEGEDFQARFIYNYFPEGPNKLFFDNVNVNAYGGRARASGNMIFPTDDFFYGVDGETENMELKPMLSALRGEEENFTGFLTSRVTLAGESGNPDSIRSKIDFDVKQSRFIGDVILTGLGKALDSSLMDDITFTRIKGEVEINDGAAHFRNVAFTSAIVNLNATGSVDLHENIDIICYLAFERKHIFTLPVFKQIASILEFMGKAFLKFRITGTLQEPKVATIPFSADELKKIIPWF